MERAVRPTYILHDCLKSTAQENMIINDMICSRYIHPNKTKVLNLLCKDISIIKFSTLSIKIHISNNLVRKLYGQKVIVAVKEIKGCLNHVLMMTMMMTTTMAMTTTTTMMMVRTNLYRRRG